MLTEVICQLAVLISILPQSAYQHIISTPSSQLYNFAICNVVAINGKGNNGAHLVPALPARGAGIYVQATQRIVVNNFQNVRVAANKELCAALCKLLLYFGRISSRITANMRHENFYRFAIPN